MMWPRRQSLHRAAQARRVGYSAEFCFPFALDARGFRGETAKSIGGGSAWTQRHASSREQERSCNRTHRVSRELEGGIVKMANRPRSRNSMCTTDASLPPNAEDA